MRHLLCDDVMTPVMSTYSVQKGEVTFLTSQISPSCHGLHMPLHYSHYVLTYLDGEQHCSESHRRCPAEDSRDKRETQTQMVCA